MDKCFYCKGEMRDGKNWLKYEAHAAHDMWAAYFRATCTYII